MSRFSLKNVPGTEGEYEPKKYGQIKEELAFSSSTIVKIQNELVKAKRKNVQRGLQGKSTMRNNS